MLTRPEMLNPEPAAEARAYFLRSRDDGALSFMHATEIFAGTLDDALSYVWHFPDETRRHAYIEANGQALEPEVIEALRPSER